MRASDSAVEAAVAASASKASYGGAVTFTAGWLLSNEFAVLIGLVVAVLGFVVNLFYKRKQDAREAREEARQQREHEARMRALER